MAGAHSQARSETRPTCDFCGDVLDPSERNRFVWHGPAATDVVLADLCARCKRRSGLLLDRYGGRGRETLELRHEVRVKAHATRVVLRTPAALRVAGRGVVYVAIALAAFIIVTLVSSLAR